MRVFSTVVLLLALPGIGFVQVYKFHCIVLIANTYHVTRDQ